MRKKSSYRPKPVNPNAVQWVINGFTPARPVDVVKDLRIKNHLAMKSLVTGSGGVEDFETVARVANMSAALAIVREAWGRDWLPELKQAKAAIEDVRARGKRTGRFVFTGPEMVLVNQILEIHDQQLEECNVQEIEKAMALVKSALAAQRRTQHIV